MKIVAFYTVDTPYEDEIKIFKEEMKKYNLDYTVYPVESKGDWTLNCGLKSKIIEQALNDHDDNILYLDADARIKRQPPFEEIERDKPGYCIVHRKNVKHEWQKLCSGTLYFPNNDISRTVVEAWQRNQEVNPNMWDQETLGQIYKNYPHFEMPAPWMVIAPPNITSNTRNPIIYHTQASRKNRNWYKEDAT